MDIPEQAHHEARAFWYSLINYEQRAPSPADLKLDHMRSLMARLGNPHKRLRILHVAGSKGKGSTSAMLAAILRRAGYRTGLFTSPHLCRVEERFQVDGVPISREELTTLLTEVQQAVRGELTTHHSPLTNPTFFEVATAVGFLHFVRRRVEGAVLEVGLGGRLDSTNVCDPAVALITSISYDHTKQLGNRLASIAAEKAGIVKPGRPAVSGAVGPEAQPVIERICRQRGAPLRQLGVDFHFHYQPGQITAQVTQPARVQVSTARRRWPVLELNLLGEHQAANAAVVIACVEVLRKQGWHLPDEAVAEGLREVVWPARLEVMCRRPLVVLDCAHNVASANALVETLGASFPPLSPLSTRGERSERRRLLVFAGSSDKDLAGMFRVLSPHFAVAYLTRYTDNPRGVAAEDLAKLWDANGGGSRILCRNPAEAWHAARSAAGMDDLICITGSVFLAGELRPLLIDGESAA
jgi:dihydrofolate synthase / folylpolyglutamate synthase